MFCSLRVALAIRKVKIKPSRDAEGNRASSRAQIRVCFDAQPNQQVHRLYVLSFEYIRQGNGPIRRGLVLGHFVDQSVSRSSQVSWVSPCDEVRR